MKTMSKMRRRERKEKKKRRRKRKKRRKIKKVKRRSKLKMTQDKEILFKFLMFNLPLTITNLSICLSREALPLSYATGKKLQRLIKKFLV